MTDEEIEKEAKEYAQGNFYSEQGFLYGYERGFAEGRKELEQWKQEWQDAQIKANEEGFARTTIQIKYKELEKENAELKKENEELRAKLERFQCCANCKSFSNCYNLAMQEGEDFDVTYKCEKWS